VASILRMRRAQRRFFRLVDEYRLVAFLARRQFGKTTTFAKIALAKMMRSRDHTVIFGSAKLNLSREIVRMEAAIIQAAVAEAVSAASAQQVRVANAETGKVPDALSVDDFADLFEHQRLEFRFYHKRSSYSRTKVIALRPDSVGETGDLMCDEIGRIANWREVWEAVSPIAASNPEFRLALSTTPPPDDSHYSFEMLAPPVGMEFTANPEGNLYESDMGVTVLRVDAWDAAADGVPVYDLKTGEPLTPEESRRREHDKDAWDRNYGCRFVMGGVGACGLMALDVAQRRGVGQCELVVVTDDATLDAALRRLAGRLGDGRVGVGMDLATTTSGTSNPTAVAVAEQIGTDTRFPLVAVWKTADPAVAQERIEKVLRAIQARSTGGRARRLAVDATNEKYFASGLRRALLGQCPVELVVGSETEDRPGMEPMNRKQFLGSRLIGELDDNHLVLPPERYMREDWRLVHKERGALACTPDVDGKHGDTFDACKLALQALASEGAVEVAAVQVGQYGSPSERQAAGGRRLAMRPDPARDGADGRRGVGMP